MSGFTPMDAGYVMVADRHAQFVKDNPEGVVHSELAGMNPALVVVKVSVWKHQSDMHSGFGPDGTGMASMPIPGPTSFTKNSEVENAETSALGRALAMIGYHPKGSFASSDEIAMKKTEDTKPASKVVDPDGPTDAADRAKVINFGKKVLGGDAQAVRDWLKKEFGIVRGADMTQAQAREIMSTLGILKATGGSLTGMAGMSDE